MAWTLTGSLDDYVTMAGEFLRSRPVHNTIQLTALQSLRARGTSVFGDVAPLFGWWRSAVAEVSAALLHTPPYPVLLTGLPERSADELAGALAASGRQLPGVNAPQGDAAAFAAAWSRLTGAACHEFRRTRLFRLEQLRAPVPFPRGAAVSLAGVSRPTAGVVRVAPVYTPPDHRGRGYGGAVTAAVSQAALDASASHVVLFTDLANPASNALYRRLGYRPVEDRVVLRFELRGRPAPLTLEGP